MVGLEPNSVDLNLAAPLSWDSPRVPEMVGWYEVLSTQETNTKVQVHAQVGHLNRGYICTYQGCGMGTRIPVLIILS